MMQLQASWESIDIQILQWINDAEPLTGFDLRGRAREAGLPQLQGSILSCMLHRLQDVPS